MLASIPNLPQPYLINGLNHIPPPPVSSFDVEFAGLGLKGTSIPSSWGTTRYYSFPPSSSALNPPNVLLVHGAGTCAIGLAPLALALSSSGYNVVAYDLWGHGLSSTPLVGHTPAIFHAQILELLSHLQWSSGVHILGFSIGGSIAATFVALYPHVAASLVLVASAGLLRKSNRSYWDSFTMDGGFGLEWLRRRRIVGFLTSDAKPNADWKENLKKGEVDSVAIQGWQRENHRGWEASLISMYNYGGVFDQHESFGLLPKCGVHVLVVLGETDGAIGLEYTKRELENLGWVGRVEVVEGAGHEVVRSHVKEVASLADTFWRR